MAPSLTAPSHTASSHAPIQPEHSAQHRDVERQFGPVAAAYLTSTPHAQGADLQRVGESFRDQPHARVLDLGCGAGHLSFAIAAHVSEVVALDLSPEMLGTVDAEAARRGLGNVRSCEAAVESLPFDDHSFDAVCTRFSAHHWADVPRALAEVRRVLRPGGRLVVIDIVGHATPVFDTRLQAIEMLRDGSHARNHSVAEWQVLLLQAGFRPGAVSTWPLPIDFEAWISRMRTPADHVAVIRGLLRAAPEGFQRHYGVQPDQSFSLDVGCFEASPM